MATVHQQVRAYLALGWSVFPVRAKMKTPALAWTRFRTDRIKDSEVETLFQPDSNIALACGKLSGVLVVDLDLYKGRAGYENLDSPLKSITPRGGIHLYFKNTVNAQNTVNDNKGTDIRAEGGYVVVPGSVLEYNDAGIVKSGTYMWVTEPTRELLDSLPEAPQSILSDIYKQNAADVTNTSPKAYLPEIGAAYEVVVEGGRNNDISRFALSMFNKYKDAAVVWNVVWARNLSYPVPLALHEVRATFESAATKWESTRYDKHITRAQLEKSGENNNYVTSTTAQDVDGALHALAQGKKQGLSTGILPLDALVGGFLPGQSYLLYADTSVGKSVMAVNMLVSMAKRGIRCLYFDLENDMTFSMERIMFSANDGAINLSDFRAHLVTQPVDMDYLKAAFAPVYGIQNNLIVWDLIKMTDRFGEITWDGVQTVMEEEIKKGLQLVIVDHLHYFSPAETDHAVLGEIARKVNNLAAQHNLSIVCVAHTKKGLIENKKGKEVDEVRAVRPTIDHIAGSGMIAKHFKNLIGIQRNPMATDEYQQSKTRIWVDKTKYGPAGNFDMEYDAATLRFRLPDISRRLLTAKLEAVDEMLEAAIVLPGFEDNPVPKKTENVPKSEERLIPRPPRIYAESKPEKKVSDEQLEEVVF